MGARMVSYTKAPHKLCYALHAIPSTLCLATCDAPVLPRRPPPDDERLAAPSEPTSSAPRHTSEKACDDDATLRNCGLAAFPVAMRALATRELFAPQRATVSPNCAMSGAEPLACRLASERISHWLEVPPACELQQTRDEHRERLDRRLRKVYFWAGRGS